MDIVKEIHNLAKQLPDVRLMEVCGGHTNTILKYGLRDVLPANIKLVSGPGCPVCVTSQRDIDCMIALAQSGVKVASYGDMINVPGTTHSLKDIQAQGADITMIYSIDQLGEDCDRVFFGVGFETTVPMTARLLERGFTVFSTHKVMPPAMKVLTQEMQIDGFIDPGHVSTIIGSEVWNDMQLPVPQVIAGFTPEAILHAILLLLQLIKEHKTDVINDYPEVVFPSGNQKALSLIQQTMKPCDAEWRGIGTITASGLEPRNDTQNARMLYEKLFSTVQSQENTQCICGQIVRGLKEPIDCPLFGTVCNPQNPQGACMVSESEGACAIAYTYGKSLSS